MCVCVCTEVWWRERLRQADDRLDTAGAPVVCAETLDATTRTAHRLCAVWLCACAAAVVINTRACARHQNRNAILADEMGLGKTIQCCSLLGLLAENMGLRGPFLVVVPLSTVPNWIREARKWVPQVMRACSACQLGTIQQHALLLLLHTHDMTT